jgi:predicted MFS family arabinose efflux permease
VLAAVAFTSVTAELLPVGLLVEISADLGSSPGESGLFMTGYALIIVATAVPLAQWSSRWPHKRALVGALLMFLAGNVLFAMATDFWTALAARLVAGAAHGLIWSVLAPMVSRVTPASLRPKALAIMFSGSTLGLAIGSPLGTALGQVTGWRPAVWSVTAVLALVTGLAWSAIPPSKDPEGSPMPGKPREALRIPGVKAVIAAWPLQVAAHFALMTYIGVYISSLGLPTGIIAVALSGLGFAALLGIWLAGLTPQRRSRSTLLACTAGMLACYILLAARPPYEAAVLAIIMVWGVSQSASNVFHQTAIVNFGDRHANTLNSLVVVGIQVGISAGSGLGALSLAVQGVTLLPIAASLPLLASLAIVFAARRHAYPTTAG